MQYGNTLNLHKTGLYRQTKSKCKGLNKKQMQGIEQKCILLILDITFFLRENYLLIDLLIAATSDIINILRLPTIFMVNIKQNVCGKYLKGVSIEKYFCVSKGIFVI